MFSVFRIFLQAFSQTEDGQEYLRKSNMKKTESVRPFSNRHRLHLKKSSEFHKKIDLPKKGPAPWNPAIHRFYRRALSIEHLLIIKDNKTCGRGWLITAPVLSVNTHKTAVLITSKLYNWTNTAFNPFRNDISELLIHAQGVKCFLFVRAKVILSDAW